jgi:DNA (cytosine-5)-methyltransferase 1
MSGSCSPGSAHVQRSEAVSPLPRVVDLFCGAGGFSLGFRAAGCEIAAAVDFDEVAGETLRSNFEKLQPESPPQVLCGDEGNLEEVDLSHLVSEAPDIVIGGPPCQGFSRVGRGKLASLSEEGAAEDARNGLYLRYLDAVRLWRPRAVVMENVPGMQNVGGRSVADEAANDLIKCGYRVGYAILNASWYGVPQFRERLIFIGLRSDLGLLPSMPPATHRAALPPGYVPPPERFEMFLPFTDLHHELDVDTRHAKLPATNVVEALGDLPVFRDHLEGIPAPRGNFRSKRRYSSAAQSSFAKLMRNWPGLGRSRQVVDHAIHRTPRDYETFRRMRPGDRYTEAISIARARFREELERQRAAGTAPDEGSSAFQELERAFVPPYPEDIFLDKWRKLIREMPSWTVPAHLSKDSYSHIHYDDAQARTISIREAARLQSFPDGYLFSGNLADCFRQIGNAVPPLMAWAVASELLTRLGYSAQRPPPLKARRRASVA